MNLWKATLLLLLGIATPALANDYYTHGSFPTTNSSATSAGMRAELDLITAGFNKLPSFTSNASKALIINGGETALGVTTGTLSLAGNFAISGTYATTLTVTGATNVTLPTTGTLATLAGSETLTTKTISLTSNALSGTTAQFNTALSDNDFATLAGSETLTTKTINLTSNTLSGTTAQFNTALSDNDFATLAGSETLTNKTLTSPTLAGTPVFPDNVFTIGGSADATKKVAIEVDGLTTGTTRTITAPDYNIRLMNMPAGIGPVPYGGSSAPTGWLLFGSDYSRTTYADLFAVVGTTFGAGDGSTTFGLHLAGRTLIAAGTGTTVDISTTSSSNGFVVTSNATKWITGMPVVLSSLSGFTSSATAGPTYYAVRVSATNLRLATTLALAQAGTPDVTLSGTGSATITYTMTARTLGDVGGEEAHAESSTEQLAHTHTILGNSNVNTASASGIVMFSSGANNSNVAGQSTGGNAAMNIMPPFAVVNYIISY